MLHPVATHTISAKITRPHYARVLPRTRLIDLLDNRHQPLVWVNGPPGAGKTALASSYLEAKNLPHLWYRLDEGDRDLPTFFHYLGLAMGHATGHKRRALPHLTAEYSGGAAFARLYFEELAARVQPPFVLVLDNYHEVPGDAELHAALRDGIAALPRGFMIIVLSRSSPPPELARIRINDQMMLLGWEELRLTLDEVKDMQALIRADSKLAASPELLHEQTQGWAGGLVLLLQQGQLADPKAPLPGASHQVLFDYFAGEIFATLSLPKQRILATTALLRKMSLRAVIELADCPCTGELLQDLNQRNYFTLRHPGAEPVYEYHPLFRDFLLARAAQMFDAPELTVLRKKAAALLEADGQIEEAADLLCAAGDAATLARLIVAYAPALVEQGRYKVIDGWLGCLPESERTANPWLLYWQGVCRWPYDPAQARTHLERAYARFKADGNLLGRCRTWCAIVDSLVFEWNDFKPLDHWIAEMGELLSSTPELPDATVDAHIACGMFLCLMYRDPAHRDMGHWEQRVLHLILHGGDRQLHTRVGTHLLLYYSWWVGDLARADLLVRTLRPQIEDNPCPLTQPTWHAMATSYYMTVSASDESLKHVNRGLEVARESGIQAWNLLLSLQGVLSSMTMEDAEVPEQYLRSMEAHMSKRGLLDKALYYHACSRLLSARGNYTAARESAGIAVAMTDEAGVRFASVNMRIQLGTVMVRTGQLEAGAELIEQARVEAKAMQSQTLEYSACMAAAAIAMEASDEDACLRHVRDALTIAAPRGWHKFFSWSEPTMAPLLAKALAHGIEPEYVAKVIKKRGVVPPGNGMALETWPWPLKIYTLGGFRILNDGQQLPYTAKSLRKPLELLCALIAFGGSDVNQSTLIDALWPDLEGDNAQRAFQTALYRLRKFLDEDVIIFKRGRLTLDTRRVWIDSFAIDRSFQDVERVLADRSSATDAVDAVTSSLLSAYVGPFLPEESGSWAIVRRERLHDYLLDALQRLARRFETQFAWHGAVRCYRRALEAEPLRQDFWYRLMICHKQLGQPAEALAVYRRCRQFLSTDAGSKPSAEIEALRAELSILDASA